MKKLILLLLIVINSSTANEARLLFFGNCIACHGEFGKKSAPHLSEVKGYYLLAYPKKEDFVNHLASWVFRPNRKKSLLPKAIDRYKLMPYLSIDIDTLKKIATYIYESDDFGGL